MRRRVVGRSLDAVVAGILAEARTEAAHEAPAGHHPRPSIAEAIRTGKLTLSAALSTYGAGASAKTRRRWTQAAKARTA